MTREELETIVTEELASRPIFVPGNVRACLDLYYRDLHGLPAREVRLAIAEFFKAPVCQRCATRSNRWPHVEEIRAQIPQSVMEQAAVRPAGTCGKCDDGWLCYRDKVGHTAVARCPCRAEAK